MSWAWNSKLLLTVLTISAFSLIQGIIIQDENHDSKSTEVSKSEGDYRLPSSIIPESYNVTLNVTSNEKFTAFDGTVLIQALVEISTDKIVLHVGKIGIISTEIRSNEKAKNNNWTYDATTEKYTILLESKLPAKQKISITMKYNGTIRDDMIGFYRSSYIDDKGATRWLAATQFQTTHARHVFPCFDEPSFKAKFNLRILRPKNFQCLSNMPLTTSVKTPSGAVWDIFDGTVRMSSYLVAFVISDFANLKNKEGNFTVWSRPNAINETRYALDVGPRALRYLSTLFGIPYSLGKMDMVAIPDFAAGAMENWGIIGYREARMLYDENTSSDWSQQKITSVIVHESVHMWFGNLVTPEWWGYLWLSEGFARYYQYTATGKLEPSWKMEQQFVVDELQSVYGVDALDSASPMTRSVSNMADISTSGDEITYAKAASVIRMMDHSFGSEIFNLALREYLNNKKDTSATPEDLWSALQHQANEAKLELSESVQTIMETWTKQPGFPVVSVTIANGSAHLTQERFLLRNPNSSPTNLTWRIPITWTTGQDPNFNSTTPRLWLETVNATINLSNNNDDDWIIFNIQEAGYYRVNYDADSWKRIIRILMTERFTEIHEINRAAIVDDMLNLARANLLDYDTALTGLNYIKRETNYLPFGAAFSGLEYLHKRFAGQPHYEYIRNLSLSIIENIYDHLSYEDGANDERLTILLRRKVNNWACKLDHEKCIEKSRFYFSEWKNKSKSIPKNQRETAYCSAIRHGNSEDWNFLWDQYLRSNSPTEQVVILEALACSRNTTILESYLLNVIKDFEDSKIRKQDSTTVFKGVYSSDLTGAGYILEFVRKYWNNMVIYNGYGIIDTVLSGASQYFSTKELVAEFDQLIKNYTNEFKTIEKSLKKSLSLANYELDWYGDNADDIVKWMVKNGKDVDTSDTTDYRLPTRLVPISYIIRVVPYIEAGKFTFDGIVEITARVAENTKQIAFHVDELEVHSVVVRVDARAYEIAEIERKPKYHFFVVSLVKNLTDGQHVTIEIYYEGKLNAAMAGFYRSSYVDDSGTTRWLAATHLEPVGARKMFPCFDEPALKATFVLSVSRPVNYTAISNTPLSTSVADGKGRVLDTFQKTPVMSTYLLALVVSDFKNLTDDKNHCAIWARPNAVNQGKYALSVMAPLLRFYEKSVKHPYQLTKLDMVALPDFASGAMENWGLLTYRETNMLYDPKNSPITSKQAIANVISHEISHQWFGDQVSPRWWNYLWLNEGFARYFQYYGTANVETEWGLESQFVVEQLQAAFGTDARASTHPMSHDVYSPSEISAIFDSISYSKAASVLRMVEKTFGTDLFYGALHDYLEARKYKDAIPDQLIEAFQKKIDPNGTALETSIKTIMDTWITQAGYPIVNVKINGTVATLSQKRFYLKNYEDTTSENIWWIPITWASKSKPDFLNTSPKYWLSEKNGDIKLDAADEWVIFNVQESGYYRVNYDTASWERIINLLKSKDFGKIHEVNRASLVDDLLTIGQAGLIDYTVPLSATQYLVNETNYIPWRAAFNGLTYLNRLFKENHIFELYKTHILHILNPIYEKLTLDEKSTESHYDKLLRRHVVDWACNLGVKSCIDSSLQLFAELKSNSTLVPVNLRATVYCTALKHGSADDWEFLWSQHLSTGVSTEKAVILTSLGCSTNKTALEKLLRSAITENSGIRYQDSLSVFSAVYSSGHFGAEYTLDFIERNHKDLFKYYGSYNSIASILSGVSSFMTTKKLVQKFEQFIEKNREDLALIELSMKKYLNVARNEIAWYEKYSPRIFEWLDKTYATKEYRLLTRVYPETYNIYLKPYFEDKNFVFEGETTIKMQVNESTSSIVLQAYELTIKDVIVYIDSVNYLKVSSYKIDPTNHRFAIYLESIVSAGSQLNIYITYTGVLSDKMIGFYRSSYTDKNGETRWLASTQFQPVYARRAFPCFDEPAFKAKFKIHIERPNDYRSLSNMPRVNSVPSDAPNRTWDSFEESVPMSSYLVAFVVSDFESLKNEAGNFTVWARPEAVQYGSYALHVGEKVLQFLERFSAIDYPIKKMDLIAIPDFQAGAMENWGLITFREYGLLQHENVTTTTYKKYLHTTVAHELVHMWFGNLVTCNWWDYIWLHEGFAQYLQTIAGDHVAPEWNLPQQFVVNELHTALQSDASPNVHAMNHRVVEPAAIANAFDTIAYSKSASVIRMMHHALGPKLFESGLRTYLEQRKYATATPDDLSSAIQLHENREKSLGNLDVSIKSLMDSWTTSPGYPVVNVTWEKDSLTLVQERFFLTRPEISNYHEYWIPITIATKSQSNFTNTRPAFWFGKREMNAPLKLKNNEWFVMNIQETGYYRVNYDVDSWNRLIVALRTAQNYDGIHAINRAQIVDDLLNLARIDYVPYDLALGATKYLEREDNHLPWRAFFNGVTFLNHRFDGHQLGQEFANYVVGLVQGVYEKTGFVDLPDENQLTQLNRELILSWACKLEHPECEEKARKLFNDWQLDENKWISPNARSAVYCAAIKHGNDTHWQFLWERYKKTEFSSEQLVILRALGCSRNVTTLNGYLKLAISTDNDIRDQDVASALESVSNAGKLGVDAMLDFLINNYKDLWQYYRDWARVANLFSNVAGKLSTTEQINKLEHFTNSSSSELDDIRESLKSAVDSAKKNCEWFQAHEEGIHTWLTQKPNMTESTTIVETTTQPDSSISQTASLILTIAALSLIFAR